MDKRIAGILQCHDCCYVAPKVIALPLTVTQCSTNARSADDDILLVGVYFDITL